MKFSSVHAQKLLKVDPLQSLAIKM